MRDLEDLKILLVDDDKLNQRLAKVTFSQIGLKCHFASNGMEALKMAKDTLYDFIFMDMHMPVMDGIESTIAIRAYEFEIGQKNRAYIVALTASDITESKEECFEAGMNEFMEKPLLKNTIIAIINRKKSLAV
jgi:CheY-like chemotaxis protein